MLRIREKTLFIILMVFKFINSLLIVGLAFVMKNLIDVAASSQIDDFLKLIIFDLFFCTAVALVNYLTIYLNKTFINNRAYVIKKRYINCLYWSTIKEFRKRDSSAYISELTNDMNIIMQEYYETSSLLIDDCLNIIISFCCVVYLNYIIAILMLLLTILLILVPSLWRKIITKYTDHYSATNEKFILSFKDSVLGFETIKLYSAENSFLDELNECLLENKKALNKLAQINNLSISLSKFISTVLQIGMMGLASYFVIIGKMEIGSIVAMLSLSGRFYGPMQNIVGRVTKIIATKNIRLRIKKFNYNDGKQDVARSMQIQKIELKDLSFAYDADVVLKNISMVFEKGKKYLIVGESGCGKSTLLKILRGILIPKKGEILVNGSNVNLDEIINISYVQQDCYMFNRSIKDNIDLKRTNEINKINNVIEFANLKEFSGKYGLNRVIDEEISQISGGEKARISLARTLYENFDILLLDEITASLDVKNAKEIERKLLSLEGKMIVNVTHKIMNSNLALYDYIYLMKQGEIIESCKSNDLGNSVHIKEYLEK